VYTGKVYDLGGQVLAASSAPVIFHLAKETGSALEEMDSHKLAVVDPSSGEYQDIKVADDYVSVMSLTLQIQVSLYSLLSCTIMYHFLKYLLFCKSNEIKWIVKIL
jgi:hypothetical protein